MKQITEDYVSFETAKLLKEKGFDEPTMYFFSADGTKRKFQQAHYLDDVAQPTMQMALKWLREEHLYHIFAKPVQLKNRVDWRAYIIAKDCDTLPIKIHGESHEQAIEAALKYALEKLI